MAKINFGNIVADARGKVGGIVLSKNKSGAYTRTKVTPANPRSIAQQFVRANFAASAQAWSGTLTQSQRDQWTAFASTFPRTNIFGNSLVLNGLNMYVSYAQVMLQLGLPPIATPPTSPAVTPATWLSPWQSLTASNVVIEETVISPQAGAYNYVFATRGLPPGRKPKPSDYRFVFAEADLLTPGTVTISTQYIAKFGTPITGQAIYGLIATADSNSGALSVSQPLAGIVT